MCSVNECTMADRIISFKLEYFNQAIQQCQAITISAWVLQNLPCDIIIGRPTIEEERLLMDHKIPLSGTEYSFHYQQKVDQKSALVDLFVEKWKFRRKACGMIVEPKKTIKK